MPLFPRMSLAETVRVRGTGCCRCRQQHTMPLETQGQTDKEQHASLDAAIYELAREMPKDLWDQGHEVVWMKKICLLTSITLCGSLGWWLGGHVSLMTGYMTGFAGNLVGVYVGCRINRAYL